MNDVILSAKDVGVSFGKFTALRGVSADFRRGELAGIIGPNGAGKSTFFNTLSGAFPPTTGQVVFEGRTISGLAQHRYAKLGIAKSFQITTVFPQLTTLENVRVALQALTSRYDVWRPRARLTALVEQAGTLLQTVGLWPFRDRLAANLAHGEQRALEVAMALASNPRLLLLDEPTAGMSPEETRSMMDLIVRLAADRTVILVEHKMKLVMGICDRLLVLHHGELLAQGTPAEIRVNTEVKRVYLGQREH